VKKILIRCGSGIRNLFDPGSGINIPDPQHCSLFLALSVRDANFEEQQRPGDTERQLTTTMHGRTYNHLPVHDGLDIILLQATKV
jgi:hypothetical protein